LQRHLIFACDVRNEQTCTQNLRVSFHNILHLLGMDKQASYLGGLIGPASRAGGVGCGRRGRLGCMRPAASQISQRLRRQARCGHFQDVAMVDVSQVRAPAGNTSMSPPGTPSCGW
jgi:hypothetical protein